MRGYKRFSDGSTDARSALEKECNSLESELGVLK